MHEMLTGKPTFRRASIPETMVAIIKEDAPVLEASVPAPLRWIVERMLAKDPRERYALTEDLYRDLRALRDRLAEAPSSASVTAVTAAPAKRRRLWPSLLAAACLVGGAAIAVLLTSPSGGDLSRYRFVPLAQDQADQFDPSWSPDGKSIAYAASVHGVYQIFVRALGAASAAQLTHAPGGCGRPFWSPDGLTSTMGPAATGGPSALPEECHRR